MSIDDVEYISYECCCDVLLFVRQQKTKYFIETSSEVGELDVQQVRLGLMKYVLKCLST